LDLPRHDLSVENGLLLSPAGIVSDRLVRPVRDGGAARAGADRPADALSTPLGLFVPPDVGGWIGRRFSVEHTDPRRAQRSKFLDDEAMAPPARPKPISCRRVAHHQTVDPLGQLRKLRRVIAGRKGPATGWLVCFRDPGRGLSSLQHVDFGPEQLHHLKETLHEGLEVTWIARSSLRHGYS